MRVAACFFILSTVSACAFRPSVPSPLPDKLEKLGRQYDQKTRAAEMAKINKEIRGLKAKLFRSADEPQARPLPKPLTEESLYSELIKSYQSGDLPGLSFYQIEFSKRFPRSLFQDNALFLVGVSLHRQGHLAKSVSYFQKIIDDFPRSNKRAAAFLHKGMVYRELNLMDLSRQSFLRIKKEYVGSPEYFQVDMELKLLDLKIKG